MKLIQFNTQYHHVYSTYQYLCVYRYVIIKTLSMNIYKKQQHDPNDVSVPIAWEVLGWAARFDSLSWVVQEWSAFLAPYGPGA